jgi:hypothetical protein
MVLENVFDVVVLVYLKSTIDGQQGQLAYLKDGTLTMILNTANFSRGISLNETDLLQQN